MKRLLATAGVFAALFAAAALWLTFGPLDERTALLIRDSRGTTTTGERLGVRIGQPWSDADVSLRHLSGISTAMHDRGMSGQTPLQGEHTDHPILIGEVRALYRDHSWRNGVIVLNLRDGVVVAVSWHYSGPFYIDT